MAALPETQTPSGKLTITETSVTLAVPAFGGARNETIMRAMITRVDSRVLAPAIFGKGGLNEVTIYTTDGRKIAIKAAPKLAAEIVSILS